ncbi:MAG: CPBP family intramembrane glutamic endopeptidase [Myxococcota bacterium]
MRPPSAAEWRLIALVLLLSWPMQLHAKHVARADPFGIPGFALLVYLAWPLASYTVLYGSRRGPAAIWLVLAGLGTLAATISGTLSGSRAGLFASGVLGAGSALAVAWHARVPLGELGLGPGEWRRWAPLTAVGMGLAVLLVQVGAWLSPELLRFYPVYPPARHDPWVFVGWELAMALYMVCWESLFRGVFLFGSRRTLGDAGAVLLTAVPFFLLHANKPELEMASSIVGGIALGYFCLWARSCWPAALLHATLYSTMELTGALVAR